MAAGMTSSISAPEIGGPRSIQLAVKLQF